VVGEEKCDNKTSVGTSQFHKTYRAREKDEEITTTKMSQRKVLAFYFIPES